MTDSDTPVDAAPTHFQWVALPNVEAPAYCFWLDETHRAPDGTGYIPNIVYENQPGYAPLVGNGRHASPWIWGPTIEDALRQVKEANERIGVSPERASEIVLSSLAASRK